jgi:hypothetical protein
MRRMVRMRWLLAMAIVFVALIALVMTLLWTGAVGSTG